MKSRFQELRRNLLDERLARFRSLGLETVPRHGWLRALRQGAGLSLREVGERMGVSPSHLRAFEASEAEGRITLRSLRRAADALECDVVYAVVPRGGSIGSMLEARARREAEEQVRAVEHSMALEGQSAGHIKKTVARETRRRLQRRK